MSTAAATAPDSWREQLFGDGISTRQSVLVLTSYPILLVLVILSTFVRYIWAALAMYCVFLFVFSCAARAVVERRRTAVAAARPGLGGLSAAAISAVAPAFLYDEEEAGQGEEECPVCLEMVKGGEKARRLPACAHTFHVPCIDMWLDSHPTCPVCRCGVLPQKKADKQLPHPSSPAQAMAEAPLPLPPV